MKKQREKNKIRNGKEEFTTDNIETQRIIREYYEQLRKLNGQPRGNGQIHRKVQASKTEPGRNRNYEQAITNNEIETVIKNLPRKKRQNPRARWLYRWILSNTYRRVNAYPSETLPKNCRGRNTSKLILRGHNQPDTKTRQRYHKNKIIGQYYWWTQTQKSSTKF